MAKKNIGATLSIKDNNFTAGIRNAITGTKNLKTHTANATGSLKKLGSQSNTAGTSLASLAKKAVGVVAAYAGFRQIVQFGKECITAADTQTRAESRLETLMMNVKGTTLQNVDAMKKYASELQGVTTVGDEVTIQGASQLATFQLQSNTIKTLLPSLQDLAVSQYGVSVSGEQMQSMSNLLGKVMTGNVGALTRYGVTMNEAQKKILKTGSESQKAAMLVEVLGQNFGGLSQAMANTPEGRIIQVKNAWGDMQEVIGMKLYPVVTSFFGAVATAMPSIQNVVVSAIDRVSVPLGWIKDNVLPPLITAFKNVWNFGVSAFNNIKTAVEANSSKFSGIITSAGGVKDAIFNAFEFCKPALNWMKDTGIPLVVNALAGVVQKATDVYNFFVNNWGWIAPIITGIVGAIVTFRIAVFAINTAMNIWAIAQELCTVAQWAWNAAMTANPIGIIIVAIGALIAIGVALWMNWDSVCKWIGGAWEWVKNAAVNIWNGICDFFVAYWPYILGIFTGGIGLVVGLVIQNWDSVKKTTINVFNTVKDTVVGVWNSIVSGIKGCINKIISAINGMIGGINKLQFNVPDWVPVIGGKTWGFNIPKIPMLAQGGIIRQPGSVLVGEKGPEWLNLPQGAKVTPLDKSTKKTENKFYITVYADGKSSDEIVDELVPKLKLALDNL